MANDVTTGIGLRRVRVAKRDTDGVIQVPEGQAAGVGYEGLPIGGALALTLTIPDPQRVTARGDDRAYYTFQLPPTETPSGELRVSKTSSSVIALLSGTKVWGESPQRKTGFATDMQGNEAAVILWGTRQGVDSDDDSPTFGQQIWQTYVLLNALATVRPASMEDAAIGEVTYSLSANDSSVDEFGKPFSVVTNGFTKASYIMVISKDKLGIDAFVGDASQEAFTLSHAATWSETGVTQVYVDGEAKATPADYSVANGVVTFTSPPVDGAKIIVEYEWA